MKNIAFKKIFCGLIVGVFGTVDVVNAAPDGSQQLRGLGGRVFMVTVEVTKDEYGIFELLLGAPVGTTFPNCYVFHGEGNNWSETAFPTEGVWSQASVGAKTGYQVVNSDGFEQLGEVGPAGGGGVLQLEAVSTIEAAGLEFVSSGHEVHGSDILDCPTGPEFSVP